MLFSSDSVDIKNSRSQLVLQVTIKIILMHCQSLEIKKPFFDHESVAQGHREFGQHPPEVVGMKGRCHLAKSSSFLWCRVSPNIQQKCRDVLI